MMYSRVQAVIVGMVIGMSVVVSFAQDIDPSGEWEITQTPEIILRVRNQQGAVLSERWLPVETLASVLRLIPTVALGESAIGWIFFDLPAFRPLTQPTHELARTIRFSRSLRTHYDGSRSVLTLDGEGITDLPIHLVRQRQPDGRIHLVGGTREEHTSWREVPSLGPNARHRIERHVAIRFAESNRFTARFRTRFHPELNLVNTETRRHFRALLVETVPGFHEGLDWLIPDRELNQIELVFQFMGERRR